MGEHKVEEKVDERKAQAFMKALLEDLRALSFMLQDNRVESSVTRIGAEQEMFLVDSDLRPAPVSTEVLTHAGEPRLTTEIARFNLEANLTPLNLSGNCFSQMESELSELLEITRRNAKVFGADVLLAGILPTLQKSDLTLDNLTPQPRYNELNRGVIEMRGGPLSIHIKGLDELQLTHDNIMMESCNTSFQVHFQTNPQDFVSAYNAAQAITGPVLAAAVNSPVLFGHRLWQETRVALFQHSTDERSRPQLARSQQTRVSFGDRWLEHSAVELFHDQISRFRPIMITEPDENPFYVLARGETPLLSALRMHNGTVWRWNRACYGVSNGVAHLRIENRALPSGPTVIDEIANAAFFIGLMVAVPRKYGNIASRMSFEEAKSSFFRAARHGLDSQLHWVDGQSLPAATLVMDQLLPLAREGLRVADVATRDIEKYLDVVEERVRTGSTGARWALKSYSKLSDIGSKDVRRQRLTAAMLKQQKQGAPVHKWPEIESEPNKDWKQGYRTVSQFMSTDLFTVHPDDLVDLAASVMDWRHIRHVPVEDREGRLVGLVTHRTLLRYLTSGEWKSERTPTTVSQIMVGDPLTVTPSTSSLEAIKLMRSNRVGCLPVVENEQLVGIVTSYDFLDASAQIFERELTGDTESPKTSVATNSI